MSTRTRERSVQDPRLDFKISFFQDVFTIIEELTGDCPEVGLPEGFRVDKNNYLFFRGLQKRYGLTKIFITNFGRVKRLGEWGKIREVINLYRSYWKAQKSKLGEAVSYIKTNIDFKKFIDKLYAVTKHRWTMKKLDVFVTIGYKDSGTYDRETDVIRIGIHEGKKDYLIYTLYHELIHYHIINHINLRLEETEEERLCRAIFSLIFKDDPVAQQHWREKLSSEEIKKINKKAQEIQSLL